MIMFIDISKFFYDLLVLRFIFFFLFGNNVFLSICNLILDVYVDDKILFESFSCENFVLFY